MLQKVTKSNPTGSQVHVSRPLTDISVAYIQAAENYVTTRGVFPRVNVRHQGNQYYKYNKGDMFRDVAQKRAPGTESAGGGFKLETDNYFADVWAFHKDVADQDRDNADQPLDLDRDATEFVTQSLLIGREVQWFSAFFTTGLWSADVTPGTLWDAAGSTPIEDIENEVKNIVQLTGKSLRDITLTVSFKVWIVLKNHPDVLDRIKHTQRGVVTEEIFAALVGIKQVVVARSVKNDAVEGATDDMQFIGDQNDALLSYAPPRPGIRTPSAGYIFNWSGFKGVGSAGSRIKKFRQENLESDRIEGQMAFDMKLVSADCGRFFDEVVT